MNVIGNGVDIINNKRIENSIKNKNFLNRIYSSNEIKNSYKVQNKVNYFAKRFAAKEAFVKSIGLGFRNNINFKDISITNNKLGKPQIHINDKINKIIKKKLKIKKFNVYLSLSDEKNHSIAFVIISEDKKWKNILLKI